ncbi:MULTISPECIES: cardiolipin synthase [Halocynthiibacter]|uniref:Cardiolipin synthase n=1 Tax=Halocynthiibacter halioticoli TaxID=2986804 RepID=A0AAE3IVR1_9RHOB|nr:MULTISPECIES: cardiolipin synthase [Halocynthiibacter]MCV6823000.1 cardiolipin synthase [Halocynthiibacter halioticoli]MCW4056001.1 cardiolipin synthase [Halocynthiibacter sp. SDUM655004]
MSSVLYFGLLLIQLATAARVMTRPNRAPASRIAWLAIIFSIPGLGVIGYLLLGETSIGKTRVERKAKLNAELRQIADVPDYEGSASGIEMPARFRSIFNLGQSISGMPAVGGNAAELLADSETAIDAMIKDIDNAKEHVHLVFYIWLTDESGTKMVDALVRAAQRGVTVRAMADDLGSRDLIKSELWKVMERAGVNLAVALKIGNPLLRMFDGRLDLRNHRKVLVIDNEVTYCGSQNCADAAFSPKPKFAPWVDAVMRFTGPVVLQNQMVFVSDWMTYTDDDILDVVRLEIPHTNEGFPAQVIATGPTVRFGAMSDMFAALMHAATDELIITTPYYAPNEAMQSALRSAANRGVKTTIVFPARNDNFSVAATCHSYYQELLTSGVRIMEYPLGLLHTKSLTIDGQVTLIGSANMDQRSFDLNYENNIVFYDPEATSQLRDRQLEYIADSNEVLLSNVESWPWRRRLWNNVMAVISPVL